MACNAIKIIRIIVFLIFLSKFVHSNISFKLSSKWDKCFFETFTKDSHPLLNYNVYGSEKIPTDDIRNAMQNIIIKAYYSLPEQNYKNLVSYEALTKPKGKMSINATNDGLYEICFTYYSGYYSNKIRLEMNFQITTDASKLPELQGVVMNENIKDMHYTLNKASNSIQNLVKLQKLEMDLEKEDEIRLESLASFFLYTTLFQIILIIITFFYILRKFFNDFAYKLQEE